MRSQLIAKKKPPALQLQGPYGICFIYQRLLDLKVKSGRLKVTVTFFTIFVRFSCNMGDDVYSELPQDDPQDIYQDLEMAPDAPPPPPVPTANRPLPSAPSLPERNPITPQRAPPLPTKGLKSTFYDQNPPNTYQEASCQSTTSPFPLRPKRRRGSPCLTGVPNIHPVQKDRIDQGRILHPPGQRDETLVVKKWISSLFKEVTLTFHSSHPVS